uniref:CHK kinase-like domain-containing protein n=1 Tax=Anopheles atroparvus TaxID=41427 RepID=A0AAG5CU21_ANOAO
METPSWRTVEFFREIIDMELPSQDVHVKLIHIGEANSEAAGYMSLIHRVTLDVEVGPSRESKLLSYIVKEKSGETFGGILVDMLSVFSKEREVYEHLLPEFERFWRTGGGGVRFGPRMFKATDGQETVIVMEDLNRSHFRMSTRRFGLPMGDVKGILSKLAKFHAASVLYREAGGCFSHRMAHGVIAENTIEAIGRHYEVLYSAFVKSLQERELPPQYLVPLKQIEGRLLKECCRVLHFDAAHLNVLNHGDLWPNNIMFGNDDLLFLDFQTAFYGCFAADILYFFITSATEIVCDELMELLRHYHQELVDSLQLLSYSKPIPSYDELFKQVQMHGVLILPPLSEAVAITMAGLTEPSDMEKLTSDRPEGVTLRKQVYDNPSFVALVDRLIPKLFAMGLFSNLTERSG